MSNLTNPNGWSKRRANSRRRHASKHSAERAQIRAVRAEHMRKVRAEDEANRQAELAARQDNAGPTTLADLSGGGKTFDLAGNWPKTRAAVKEALGLEKSPRSKKDAAAALQAAGYTVTGFDAS